MHNCRECDEFLIDFLEGTLPADQAEEFQRHLALCPRCVEYLERYRTTMRAERAAFDADTPPAPEDVPEEIIAAILLIKKHDHGGCD